MRLSGPAGLMSAPVCSITGSSYSALHGSAPPVTEYDVSVIVGSHLPSSELRSPELVAFTQHRVAGRSADEATPCRI